VTAKRQVVTGPSAQTGRIERRSFPSAQSRPWWERVSPTTHRPLTATNGIERDLNLDIEPASAGVIPSGRPVAGPPAAAIAVWLAIVSPGGASLCQSWLLPPIGQQRVSDAFCDRRDGSIKNRLTLESLTDRPPTRRNANTFERATGTSYERTPRRLAIWDGTVQRRSAPLQ
jgi:hypothetical protein